MRRRIGFLVPALIGLGLCVSASAIAQDANPLILEAMSLVSPDEIETDLRILTGQTALPEGFIESRDIRHPDHALTVDYLAGRMEESGAQVELEDFDFAQQDCSNLVAEIPGHFHPESIWLIGAHFDSTNGENPQDPAPGAVDNASGVVIVLQVLSALRHYAFSDTIRFVLFDAEEEGLVGSDVHAQTSLALGEQIALVANLDIPGWRFPDWNTAFANSDNPGWPDLQMLVRIPERYPVGTEIFGVPAPFITASDIAPFWEAGYHGFTLGSLYALMPWMNTADDTYERLDLEQCANLSRALIAYIAERAAILGEVDDDSVDETADDAADDSSDDTQTGDDASGDDGKEHSGRACGC